MLVRACRLALLAALPLLIAPRLAAGEAPSERRLTIEAGHVSATFTDAPAPAVLDTIRSATGIEIVLPPSASTKTVTLAVERMPFDQFVRRLLEGLDLGGFALVYEPDGMPTRVIVADKGTGRPSPASPLARATKSEPSLRARTRPAVSVPFLIDTREARSMKLGTPGQVLVVQTPSMGKARTDECGAPEGDYPVQTVLVTDGSITYVTSIVVCRAEALPPGETVGLSPAPATESGSRSRFNATTP